MQDNLPLEYPSENADEHERMRVAADVLRRKLADAVDEIGRKTVCFDLDITNQLLTKRLNADEGKQPTALMLLYCLAHERSGRLARYLASGTGYAPFVRPEVLTPEQRLARLESALRANPSMARLIYDEAFGPPAPTALRRAP